MFHDGPQMSWAIKRSFSTEVEPLGRTTGQTALLDRKCREGNSATLQSCAENFSHKYCSAWIGPSLDTWTVKNLTLHFRHMASVGARSWYLRMTKSSSIAEFHTEYGCNASGRVSKSGVYTRESFLTSALSGRHPEELHAIDDALRALNLLQRESY